MVTGVSKELSLAPAVDSFVSKVSFTMEQLIEIVRQHKQFIDGAYLDQSDKMYSLACDWLKNNADALEFLFGHDIDYNRANHNHHCIDYSYRHDRGNHKWWHENRR